MTTFQNILDGKVNLTDPEKEKLARDFLKKEYDITVKDSRVLSRLLDVHHHSPETPVHLGHPELVSSFGRSVFQFVFVTDNWHLSFIKEPSQKWTLIHPKREKNSWNNPENQKAVSLAKSLLKSSDLFEPGLSVPVVQGPVAAVGSDGQVSVYIPDNVVDETQLNTVSGDQLIFGDPNNPGSTINIDINSLGITPEK